MSKSTLQSAIDILAERTHDNKRNIAEKDRQRRNQIVDLYGVDYSRNSNKDNEAILYISISPDLVYYERFQFKLYIEEGTTATDFQIFVKSRYYRNPDTDAYETKLIDVTPYLQAQFDGEWIEGGRENAYPNNRIVEPADTDTAPASAYDLLEVASMMYAEGREDLAEAILIPEHKEIVIKADAEFFAALVLYLKYSHLNR